MKLAAVILSALLMHAAAPAVDSRVADAAMQGNRELVRTLLNRRPTSMPLRATE